MIEEKNIFQVKELRCEAQVPHVQLFSDVDEETFLMLFPCPLINCGCIITQLQF